ncbi:hypothetical protein ABPG74_000832 [Tetrahymena malaccensis]
MKARCKLDGLDNVQRTLRQYFLSPQSGQKSKSQNNLQIQQQLQKNYNTIFSQPKLEKQQTQSSLQLGKQDKLPQLAQFSSKQKNRSKQNLSVQISQQNKLEEQTKCFQSQMQMTPKNQNQQINYFQQKSKQEQAIGLKSLQSTSQKFFQELSPQQDQIKSWNQQASFDQRNSFAKQNAQEKEHLDMSNNQSFQKNSQDTISNQIQQNEQKNNYINYNIKENEEKESENKQLNQSKDIYQDCLNNQEMLKEQLNIQPQNPQLKCFKYTLLKDLHPIMEVLNFEDGSYEIKKNPQENDCKLIQGNKQIPEDIKDSDQMNNNQNYNSDFFQLDNNHHQYTFKHINKLSEQAEQSKVDLHLLKAEDNTISSKDQTIRKGTNQQNNSNNNSPQNFIHINNNKINQIVNYSLLNNNSSNNSNVNINNNYTFQNNNQILDKSSNQQQQQYIYNQERVNSSSSNTRAQMKQQSCKFYEGDESLYETYSLEKCFAKSNSYVYEARNRLNDSLTECVKQVRITERDCTYEQFINECNILEKTKLFPHQNMIKYCGYFITKENNDSQILIGNIVMERGKQSLKMFMQQRQNQNKKQQEELSISQVELTKSKQMQNSSEIEGAYFNEVEVVEFMKSMIDVHYHLQKNNIAHRDIKPQNILIVEDDDQNIIYKVCDVGSGVGLESSSQYTRTRTVAGTEVYMSPEVYTGIYSTVTQYNPFKSDVFSLGLVFLEFLTFKLVDKDKKVRLDKDKYMVEVKDLRHEAKKRYKYIFGLNKILKQMLVYNQNDRVTFQDLYQQVFEENRLTILSSRQQQIERLSSSIWEEVMNKDNIMELLEESVKNNVSSFRIELNSVQPKQLIEQFTKLKETIKRIMLKKLFLSLDQIFLTVEQSKLLGEAISKAQLLVNLELSMFQSSLGEQGCIHLLQGVSACVKLKVLKINISNNMIGSQGIINGLQNLAKLTQLSELILDLSQNQLGLECVDTICNVLQGCNQIKKLELKLANNSITYKGVKQMKDSMENLKQLQSFYLNLSQNQFFADQGFIQVGNLIENITQLRELTIVVQVNSIQNRGLKEFSLCLQNLVNLRHFNLYIWGNQIEGAGFEQLGKAIQALESLESIQMNLTNNNVTSVGLSEIEKGLTNKKRITKIRLQMEGCGLVSEDMIYVGRIMSIQQLKTVSLNIQNNKLDDKAALYIASGLQHSKCIEEFHLNLSDSNISGPNHLQIWKQLLQGKFLNSVYYSARNNQLDDKTLDQIIKMGESFKKLKYFCLDLESNLFTQANKKKFEEDLRAYFKKNKVLELII